MHMSNPTNQTASFLMRFTQRLYEDESGETGVQWRGKISHVQGDEQLNFIEFNDAIDFIKTRLSELTLEATEDKSPEEQEGLLRKSFDIWKKVATSGPKIVMDAIKDPKKQVAHIQDQLHQVSDEISQRIEIDSWRAASRNDFKSIMDRLDDMNKQMADMAKELAQLSKKR